MGLANQILRRRNTPGLRRVCREVGYLMGFDIPPSVEIGRNFELAHRGMGTVIHGLTTIGNDVTIYHGVTIGRQLAGGGRVHIGDKVVLSVGVVILSDNTDRTIGEGAFIGANAVVTCDVPPWEVWVGVPARKLRDHQAPS